MPIINLHNVHYPLIETSGALKKGDLTHYSYHVNCVCFYFICWLFLADLGPVRADFPVGAELELTRLCGVRRREGGAALGVDHGGAVPKALPALELPLLHAGAAGHAAL